MFQMLLESRRTCFEWCSLISGCRKHHTTVSLQAEKSGTRCIANGATARSSIAIGVGTLLRSGTAVRFLARPVLGSLGRPWLSLAEPPKASKLRTSDGFGSGIRYPAKKAPVSGSNLDLGSRRRKLRTARGSLQMPKHSPLDGVAPKEFARIARVTGMC